MSEQIFKEGDTIKKGKITLECVFVTWREVDGVKEKFAYNFREVEEVKQERKDAENPEPINEESKGE